MHLHTYSSNSDGNKWSSSERGSSSIAAAMSMAAKGTHYFPCTLARHNFCIFFVSSIQRFQKNIIPVSSQRSPVLTQYNKVLGVPDLFEVSGFVDRIFWSALSGYPGAVKIGEIVWEEGQKVTVVLWLLVVRPYSFSRRESRELWKASLFIIELLCIGRCRWRLLSHSLCFVCI